VEVVPSIFHQCRSIKTVLFALLPRRAQLFISQQRFTTNRWALNKMEVPKMEQGEHLIAAVAKVSQTLRECVKPTRFVCCYGTNTVAG
jgi:hypothetical protein